MPDYTQEESLAEIIRIAERYIKPMIIDAITDNDEEPYLVVQAMLEGIRYIIDSTHKDPVQAMREHFQVYLAAFAATKTDT